MSETYLAHHGVLGQKWGVRRQRQSSSRSRVGGKAKISILNADYKSQYGREMYSGNKKAMAASNKLDKQINDYRKSMSLGKQYVRELVMTDSMNLTYDMARANGYGRARSYIKSWFDLSVPTFALGSISTTAANIGMRNPNSSELINTAGAVAGRLADRAISNEGSELSLRQRALRRRYVRNNS